MRLSFSRTFAQDISMKLLQIPFAFLTTCVLCGTSLAVDTQKLMSEGQTAMIRGDMETAKSKFELVNKLEPKNLPAIAYLRQIAAQEAQKPTSPQQEKQLSQLIIPKLEFREATFTAALDFMRRKATELSGGKQSVNFVVQIPADAQNTPVTLNLQNIPFTEALRYIAELAGAKVEYQKFAVVIRTGGAATTASTTKDQPAPATPQ